MGGCQGGWVGVEIVCLIPKPAQHYFNAGHILAVATFFLCHRYYLKGNILLHFYYSWMSEIPHQACLTTDGFPSRQRGGGGLECSS